MLRTTCICAAMLGAACEKDRRTAPLETAAAPVAVPPVKVLAAPRAVPAVPGFNMNIELEGADIRLDWEDTGDGIYEVWRSTYPYFQPDTTGTELLAAGLTESHYVDPGANDATPYYYRVRAGTAMSTICGKVVQTIVPGYNKVAQPLLGGESTAWGLAHSFEEHIAAAYKWNAINGYYSHWYDHYPHGWDIFEFGLGDCPIVQPAIGAEPFLHTSVGQVPAFGEMDLMLHPGYNYVTLPLHMGEVWASELWALLPPDSTISRPLPTGPGQPYSGGHTTDFRIPAGSCISVSVSGEASWPPPFDPLTQLDETFDDPHLEGWSFHRQSEAHVEIHDGELYIEPHPHTQWYQQDEAFHLATSVSGNFSVTASLSVTNASGGPTWPGETLRIGGLMVRDPTAPEPNTYHVGLGVLLAPQMIFEHKSTQQGVSTVGSIPYPSTDALLRVCRLDDMVHGLLRAPGGDWQLMHTAERPDLPGALLAGPIAYSAAEQPDLTCTVDSMEFRTIEHLEDCMAD